MASITIPMERISSAQTKGEKLEVTCEMTETDMKAAFGEFLEHITDAGFDGWRREFGLDDQVK